MEIWGLDITAPPNQNKEMKQTSAKSASPLKFSWDMKILLKTQMFVFASNMETDAHFSKHVKMGLLLNYRLCGND